MLSSGMIVASRFLLALSASSAHLQPDWEEGVFVLSMLRSCEREEVEC